MSFSIGVINQYNAYFYKDWWIHGCYWATSNNSYMSEFLTFSNGKTLTCNSELPLLCFPCFYCIERYDPRCVLDNLR